MRRLLLALGVVLTIAGFGALLAPDRLPGVVFELTEGRGRELRYLVGGALLFVVILSQQIASSLPTPPATPERASAGASDGLTTAIDEHLDAALADRWAYDHELTAGRDDTEPTLVDLLREATVDAVAHAEGCSVAAAETAVEQGTWTENSLAASLFADLGQFSVWFRLKRWLLPRRTLVRQVDALVAELERLGQGETE